MRERRANKEGGNCWLNFELLTSLYMFMAAPTRTILRNLSSDDGDFNENDIKAISLYWQNMQLCTWSRFLVHCVAVTAPLRREKCDSDFLFFSWTSIQFFGIEHLTNWHRWNKRDKVWSCANSLLKWRFRSRRRPLKLRFKDTVVFPLSDCPKCKIYTDHLQEVVAYENRTNRVSYWEEIPTHPPFGR